MNRKLSQSHTTFVFFQSKVSSEMTKFDVRNYLTKIYNVPVMDVKTVNISGTEKSFMLMLTLLRSS